MTKKSPEIDLIDREIMHELLKNSNRSYRTLAKDLKMSPASLIERIRKLEKSSIIIGYGAKIDYSKLGFEFMGLVEIHISAPDILIVERKISLFEGVAAVWDTTGQYDAMAVLMCKNRAQLSALVKKILSVEGVEKTNTNVVLNVVKRLTEFEEV